MKYITFFLSILILFAISCNQTRRQAETTGYEIIAEEDKDAQQSEKDARIVKNIPVYWSENGNIYHGYKFSFNDSYYIRIREISDSEYTVRRREARHLRQRNNYEVIRDGAILQELLGDRVRGIGEFNFWYDSIEVTHRDGIIRTHYIVWPGWFGGANSYYPELGILTLVDVQSESNIPINLNDSEKRAGLPSLHNLSPDRQWRLNGVFVGGWHNIYFLEKWNPTKEQFEFVGIFDNIPGRGFASYGFWVNNSTLLLDSGTPQGSFEIKIIAK